MPLIPQQDIVVIGEPYVLAKGQSTQEAAVQKLRQVLLGYPDCRVVSISGGGLLHGYTLTVVIETV